MLADDFVLKPVAAHRSLNARRDILPEPPDKLRRLRLGFSLCALQQDDRVLIFDETKLGLLFTGSKVNKIEFRRLFGIFLYVVSFFIYLILWPCIF